MAEPYIDAGYLRRVVSPIIRNNRKVPMRFSCCHDILLLKEVVAVNPYSYENPKTAWINISENLQMHYTVDGRRCRERTNLLLQYYENDEVSLRRSGTEEEFNERNQLLQKVRELRYEAQIATEKKSTQPAVARLQVADAAVVSLRPSSPDFPSDEDTNFPRKRKQNFLVSYLQSKQDRQFRLRQEELDLKKEELQVELKRLKLEQEKLDLEKEKFNLERKERESRYELERKERETRLKQDGEEKRLLLELLMKTLNKD
ncbi:trichohyalin-like [Centruroides sculpturatus]|uniref:trichohyalin-like n=1 Tax=Centruroides sculpturatus TaxID=218467 RepID=UPI000C6D5B21|nr:trichohyalin-like [Centruroides sculpturatus]